MIDAFYRYQAQTTTHPLAMEVAYTEGSYIYDKNHKAYLDFVAGVSACSLGHRHPKVVDAIKKQLDEHGVNCIVVGPSNNTTFLDNQVGRSDMQYVIIDVLATETALTPDGYRRFMEGLADRFAGCRR